jgi:hypothetical protein
VVVVPLSVMVTNAVDVEVPTGRYCTVMVQLPPGWMTAPDTHVPPVIENSPNPAVLVIVGAAVRVSEPAVAPVAVLPTVMVPFFTVVLAVVVASAGVGPANAAVAPKTVNVTALVLPFGVTALTFFAVSAALPEILNVAVTVVEFTAAKLLTVTPDPETFTPVAPLRFAPVRVTETVEFRTPELGVIEVNVGVGAEITVKVTALLAPPGVVTVTFQGVF